MFHCDKKISNGLKMHNCSSCFLIFIYVYVYVCVGGLSEMKKKKSPLYSSSTFNENVLKANHLGKGEKYRKCLLLQVISPSQFSGHGILFLVIKSHYSPDSERLSIQPGLPAGNLLYNQRPKPWTKHDGDTH